MHFTRVARVPARARRVRVSDHSIATSVSARANAPGATGSLTLCTMDSLGLGHGRSETLDPNAHTADWTKRIGMSTAAFCLVVLVLRYLCCAVRGRAVNDTDAPELEEFNSSEGKRARRVDSIRQGKAGRYVSAAPLVAADEPEATAWEGRPKEARQKKAPRKGRAPRTRPL